MIQIYNGIIYNLIYGGEQNITSSASMSFSTISVAGNTKHLTVYTPSNYREEVAYPVMFFFAGDGTPGSTVLEDDAVVGTGTLFSGSFTSPGNRRVLCQSVIVRDNGVEVARGRRGVYGNFVGPNITGSWLVGTGSAQFSFTSSVPLAGPVTMEYGTSGMLLEGPPYYFNTGDDADIIFIGIQNSAASDYSREYFDKAVQWVATRYNINPKRIYTSAISRGGRNTFNQMSDGANTSTIKSRYQFWIDATGSVQTSFSAGYTASGIAASTAGTAEYGGTFAFENYTDMGIAVVQGTTDTTLTNQWFNLASVAGAYTQSFNNWPKVLNLDRIGHNATAWHTNYANRRWLSNGTGTAPWDYLVYSMKHSLDYEERATLFVEEAERRREGNILDIIDYREALIKVQQCTGSAISQSLLDRLEVVKNNILNGGKHFYINIRGNAYTTASAPINLSPYNDTTAATAGMTLTNLKDIDLVTQTGYGFTIVTGSGGNSDITSNRGRFTVGGHTRSGSEGGNTITNITGSYRFVGLNQDKTYDILIWHNEGSGNYTATGSLTVKCSGSIKTEYSAINTLRPGMYFPDIIPSASSITFELYRTYDRDIQVTTLELYEHP